MLYLTLLPLTLTQTVAVLEAFSCELPKTLDEVDEFSIATPLTFAHFFNTEHGSFYGIRNDMARCEPKNCFLRFRPEVPEVGGLYLAGQDVICNGVFTAAMGGMVSASKVLGKKNPFSLLK